MNPDPAGFADGPNLYAYCHNRPLTHFDPNGLMTWGEAAQGINAFGAQVAERIVFLVPDMVLGLNAFANECWYRVQHPSTFQHDYIATRDFVQTHSTREITAASFGLLSPSLGAIVGDAENMTFPELMRHAGNVTFEAGAFALMAKGMSTYGATTRLSAVKKFSVPASLEEVPLNPRYNKFNLNVANAPDPVAQNIRVVRTYARKNGLVKEPNPLGKAERWGRYDTNAKFRWNIAIKSEPSAAPGIGDGSLHPRADIRLDYNNAPYYNLFTGKKGTKAECSHIPLDTHYF